MFAICCRLLCAAVLLLAASGCAMCSSCDDYSYPLAGGIVERLDPVYGRVGSIFTPEVWAGGSAPLLVDGEQVPPGEPTPAEGAAPGDESSGPEDLSPNPLPLDDLQPSDGMPQLDGVAPQDGAAPADLPPLSSASPGYDLSDT